MKKRVQLLVAIVVSVLLLPAAALTAMETATPTEATTAAEQAPVPAVDEDPKSPEYAAKLKERLAKRKEAVKTKLTKAQETRLKARCKSAQGLVQSVASKAKESDKSREEVYGKILTKLTTLQESLKQHNVSTTELEKQIVELDTMITTFKTDMANLRQAAADLSNMDCASDPSGFKASLDALRTARETVAKDSVAIRTYVTDTIQPTLKTLRTTVKDHNQGGN